MCCFAVLKLFHSTHFVSFFSLHKKQNKSLLPLARHLEEGWGALRRNSHAGAFWGAILPEGWHQ